ncbi:MAG: TonB-dependent copper receptor [Pseudomonadales bacterium]|nr:TonB-dependent copper receptor [Pseudomonadales bacterium]MCP5356789.1 TonB-dependent copper receptor [Pseudomonadales bacterium]
MILRRKALVVAILSASASTVSMASEAPSTVEEMVVTGVRTDAPLNVSTNPKAPRQPVPAHDGADYLKTIPGFSVIRKGGADGDPIFRGMAGSRLSMLVDGETILGGCGNRMDPPTAYIFPEAFDSIQVIKGPQSVKHGPGNSAGVVLFERNQARPQQQDLAVHTSLLAGSFGRHDEVLDANFSTPEFSIRGSATNAEQDNYEDGDGVEVHSQYRRWNTQMTLAWTPDDNTRVEVSGARSDGEAAYADRGVDGSKFARDNYGVKFNRDNIGNFLKSVEAQAYYNYVDHVMDNYTLRTPTGMMPNPAGMNPDRKTTGARFSMTFAPSTNTDLVVGVDTQDNKHTNRTSMNQNMVRYQDLPRVTDAEFSQTGVFAELGWNFGADNRVIGGLRADDWEVKDARQNVSITMMSTAPNPTYGQTRSETLNSGFLRYETGLESIDSTFYVGVGHNERFPDYWELVSKESATTVSAMNTKSEKLTQLDTGLIYKGEKLSGSVSAFYNEIDDFILIQSGYIKPVMAMGGMGGMMGGMATTRAATITRNVDARSWGMEVDAMYRFNLHWRSELTLASVRGTNLTDNRTLPQLPPLEARLSLQYDNNVWSAGLLWRALAKQDRVDVGRGNIAGQDIGVTDSANILSFNAGWKPTERVLVTAGVDNLLDKTYAEHISRAGAAIPGFDQTTRVNEPGRTAWLKAQYSF